MCSGMAILRGRKGVAMVDRRRPLLYAGLIGLVGLVALAGWARSHAAPNTPLSEFAYLILWAALVVSALAAVVALIAVWRLLRRPMLWFGMLGCVASLCVAIVL